MVCYVQSTSLLWESTISSYNHMFLLITAPYENYMHCIFWTMRLFLYILIYELLDLLSVFYPNHFKEADFRQALYSGINWMIPICGKAVYGVIPVYW